MLLIIIQSLINYYIYFAIKLIIKFIKFYINIFELYVMILLDTAKFT